MLPAEAASTPQSTTSATPSANFSSTAPRIGLDLAWYIRGGFGSLHGVNPQDGAAVYNYLTHGWRQSNGQYGGFFTAYAYELHSPPLYPPQYPGDVNWLLSFIHAANNDSSGQRAKVFIRLVAINNFDPTLLGTLQNFLQRLGPASQNPAVVGFGFRGAQEGIYEGGGTCCAGPEGSNFVPASIAYGPSGMDSFPQNLTQWGQMWGDMQSVANTYGYLLGISTSLSSIDKVYGQPNVDSVAQWFMQDTGYGACGRSDATGTCTYNTWYSRVASPRMDASVSVGVVGGEWDQNWFVPNNPPYYITQTQVQAMFHGFADGYAKNPQGGQFMFIYGMPYLTNDDPTWVNSRGPSPYMAWFFQYAQEYGFFTDYSPAPPPGPVGGGTTQTILKVPTGLYIHILGDPSLAALRPGWSQTNPSDCCGGDTFSVDGQLTNLETGRGIPGAEVVIMEFDFAVCRWTPVATVTTNAQGYYGYPNGGNTPGSPLLLPTPPLPNTGRNQAYFYPAYLGDSTYGPSNGVLEDLPLLPAGTTVTTTSTQSTGTPTASSSTSATTTTTVTTTTSSSSQNTPTPDHLLTIGHPPLGVGSTDPAPGSYSMADSSNVTVTAVPGSGWRLDHWVVDGLAAGNGTSLVFTMTRNFTVFPMFAHAPPVPSTSTVSFTSKVNLNVTITVDGRTLMLPASFSWTTGSTHTLSAPLILTNGTAERGVFAGWEGYPYVDSPSVAIVASSNFTVVPIYRIQYLANLSFVDCSGNAVAPQSISLGGPAGSSLLVSAGTPLWLDAGGTYQVRGASVNGAEAAAPSDGIYFDVRGPGVTTVVLPVCDASVRVTDLFGLPVEGATVILSYSNGTQVSSLTDSSGQASFKQVYESPRAIDIYYLGMSVQAPGALGGDHAQAVTLVLSYPFLYSAAAFVALASSFFLFRRFRRWKREKDDYAGSWSSPW